MTADEPPPLHSPGVDTLSNKEKETLRLILRGHDAKSTAHELGRSVHTINERLRDARRKLEVSSSREAARRLFAAEGGAPESLGDKLFGDAGVLPPELETWNLPSERWAKRRFVLTFIGVIAMSLVLAALLLPALPMSLASDPGSVATQRESDTRDAGATHTAENWLELLDESRWADSYGATGSQFRELNSLERWTVASLLVRPALGEVLTRELVANEFVPAPPNGYQLVRFRTSYANRGGVIETLSLVREDGQWKVVGIMIE